MRKRPCIMTVDDDQGVLRLLKRVLEPEGYDVIVADNGTVGLELFEENMPDLVILDIMMPGLDGFQVLGLIRERISVPVIMLSAKREVDTVRDALVLGADDYVRKPFHTQELLARVKAKLRRATVNSN
ncbi:response regulator transcription factor [Chloroflexota bacterium]